MKTLFYSLWILLSFPAVAQVIHLQKTESVNLFRSSNTYEHNYAVISGNIVHQEQSDDYYTEGYHASKSILFSGKRHTLMYDYDARYSVDFILQRISASLRQQGYFSEYECLDLECGEPEAIQAFFDPLMNSYEGHYGYQVFSRNLRNDDVISVYAVLIDSQVRVLIDVFGEPADTKYINLSASRAETEFSGLTVYFTPASTKVNDSSAQLIKDFVEKFSSQPNGKLLVKGHSDRAGNEQNNKTVSTARANKVYQLLSNEHSDMACKAQSYHAAHPYFYPLSVNNKVTDRRVEIVILEKNESC